MTLARLAATLAELVDAKSFHCWMPEDVKEFNYAEFRNALHFFSRKDSWIICQKGCQRGDGNPSCAIRDCCRNLKVDLCFDCSRFPCERVKGNTGMIEGAIQYQKLGRDEWLRQTVEKARQRWEDHTKEH